MRFSTVAIFAATAMAGKIPHSAEESSSMSSSTAKHSTTSTVYETKTYTISDCPETVTECPYDHTSIVTETIAVSTTVCEVEETDYPEMPEETTSCTDDVYPTGGHNKTMTYKPHPPKETSTYYCPGGEACPDDETSTAGPIVPTDAPECPYTKVKTISTSYTTVIPTVIYETYTEECPSAPEPTNPGKPVYPSHDGGCYGANCSAPAPVPTSPVTAGAGSTVASVVFAAAAGLAAFALA